ncbi:MAG: hypothetical protein ACREON_14060 [Gemmatimonadaceae bacterium]
MLLLLLAQPLHGQRPTHVYLRSAPRGEPAALLAAALGQAHTVLGAGERRVQLPRDSAFGSTVVVLAGETTVASTVRGDVLVLGGDLFLHPGASVDGSVIAIGGGVYDSDLASVGGRRLAFRDLRVELVETDSGVAVDLSSIEPSVEEPVVTLPLLYGLRGGEYNRVDGLVLSWGPRIALGGSRLALEPVVSYRSELGEVDPSLLATLDLGGGWAVRAAGERTTYSNDRWIQPDILNSITTFVLGRDVRNYYRADRFEIGAHRQQEFDVASIALMLQGRTEDASSVSGGHPWSIFDRDDPDGIVRPNPPVTDGRITSAVAGLDWRWAPESFVTGASVMLERSLDTPGGGGSDFTQLTVNADLTFTTFGTQSVTFEMHGVATASRDTPRQRYAYIGGTGTLPTFDPLQFGGDQLFLLESHYDIPISRLTIPFLGPPVFSLRHVLGAAGVDRLPSLEQNLGARVTWGIVRFSYMVEPISDYGEFSIGISSFR